MSTDVRFHCSDDNTITIPVCVRVMNILKFYPKIFPFQKFACKNLGKDCKKVFKKYEQTAIFAESVILHRQICYLSIELI